MELLERDEELCSIRALWDDALAGHGSVVVIAGESGIGKTALARTFAEELSSGGYVLWGVCDPLRTPRPLGPLHDIADQLGGPTASLLSDRAPSHEIFAAILDELTTRSHLLVIDDLQWADEGTVDLLRFLVRRIDSTRSLVLATYRQDEIGVSHPLRALLGDVARSPAAVTMELERLSLGAVAAMIGRRDIDAAEVHRITCGNSFFVSEVVNQGGEHLPPTVRDAVLARTMALDAAARDFADLLACAPGPIPDTLLPALGVGIEPLRALHAAGLIERSRRGVAFRHDIVRRAIAEAIPPGGEVALHRRMIDALEATDEPDPALLAHHAVGAGDADRVRRYAPVAGVVAARSGAHTEAAAFFETALTHAPPTAASEEADLLELLAAELYLTDRLQDAISACYRALTLRAAAHDTDGVGRNHRALAVYEWYNANCAVAERHATTAVEVLEPGGDPVEIGHAYATESYLAMQRSDLDRARRSHARAAEIARHAPDRQLVARLGLIEATIDIMSGDHEARHRILELIEKGADRFDEVYSSGYSNLAYLDVEQRRFGLAESVLARSIPLTVERDVPICHGWQLGARGRLNLLRGNWEAAVRDADEVLDGDRAPLTRTWPMLVRGLARLRRGDPGSRADLDGAWKLAARFGEPLRQLPAAAALAEQAWLTDEPDVRLDAAEEMLRKAELERGLDWSLGELAVWLRRLGYEVETADLCLAQVHRLSLTGRHRQAAALWRDLEAPYEQALCLVDTGTPSDVFAGLELLDHMGAVAVAAKVRRDLRDRGITGVPSRPRASTRKNPAGLTNRQLDVLRLLAEGLTNAQVAERLFISPKTADHHVSAILAKLDVSTRQAAAESARALGIVT